MPGRTGRVSLLPAVPLPSYPPIQLRVPSEAEAVAEYINKAAAHAAAESAAPSNAAASFTVDMDAPLFAPPPVPDQLRRVDAEVRRRPAELPAPGARRGPRVPPNTREVTAVFAGADWARRGPRVPLHTREARGLSSAARVVAANADNGTVRG